MVDNEISLWQLWVGLVPKIRVFHPDSVLEFVEYQQVMVSIHSVPWSQEVDQDWPITVKKHCQHELSDTHGSFHHP